MNADSTQAGIDELKTSTRIIPFLVFIPSIAVAFIATIAVIFPLFLTRSFGGMGDLIGLNHLEFGIFAFPVIIVNVICLAIGFAYWKKKLPGIISKSFKFVYNFEVSRNVAFLTICVILGFYILFSINEIFTEEVWTDYSLYMKPILRNWEIEKIGSYFSAHVKYFLGTTSMEIFGYYQAIPFIGSISLLVLTYFTTAKITGKRFAGIVAMVVLIQSGSFLIFDTSITYSFFWVLFYLLSLYLVDRFWPTSPISFILAIYSKGLVALFLPMTFFYIFRAKLEKKRKIILFGIYAAIVIFGIVFVYDNLGRFYKPEGGFDSHDFWKAFGSIAYQLRYDWFMLTFLIPTVTALFFVARKGIKHAESLMILISGMILSQPILAGLTENASEPYRWIPLTVIFAVSVGVIFSKTKKQALTQ